MGSAIIKTGGVGADSDELTAYKEHILEGHTAVTHDSDGDPITGTMPNRGIGSHAINSGINEKGLWYYISPGYYPGSATDQGNCWVYRSPKEVASSIGITSSILRAGSNVLGVTGDNWTVWTGDVTAEDSHVLSGKTYWKQGAKRTGSITSMGGQTITPSTMQQTVQSNGKYMTGNVIVPGFTMPPADAIKKGYTLKIYNQQVTGTFEGYTTSSADIYRQGAVNPNYPLSLGAGAPYTDDDGNYYRAITEFRSNTIYVYTTYNNHWSNSIFCSVPINMTPINKVHISIRGADGVEKKSTYVVFGAYESPANSADRPVVGDKIYFKPTANYKTLSIDVSSITRPLYVGFWASCESHVGMEINHIWFE